MKKQSKFDYAMFYFDYERMFAVSKQKFSREQAIALFEQECDAPVVYEITDAAVRWRAGVDMYGERRVCWWLELDYDGTEPRCCPVWVFEFSRFSVTDCIPD